MADLNLAQQEALADDFRREIHDYLCKTPVRSYSLGEISAHFKADPAPVFYQLGFLEAADLLETEWRGATVVYRGVAT